MLKEFADWISYGLIGLDPGSGSAEAVAFFFYDTLKITLLLFATTLLMGVVNAYFPVDRLQRFLTNKKLYGFQYFLASLFGAVTPFCSCSSIPLFIGFLKGGIPLGVTFSFLITSPLVNEIAVAVFLGAFGWKPTIIYIVSGLVLGTLGGFLLRNLNPERYLSRWVIDLQRQSETESEHWEATHATFGQRAPIILKDALTTVRGVLLYIIIGIGIGAGIHGYLPENFFAAHFASGKWYDVPLAVTIGVPMYAGAAGIIPVIQVLVAKGIPLGTAIAFMMSVIGLSLPEATMLKKAMTWKLIAIFFSMVTGFIILSGYLFNFVLE